MEEIALSGLAPGLVGFVIAGISFAFFKREQRRSAAEAASRLAKMPTNIGQSEDHDEYEVDENGDFKTHWPNRYDMVDLNRIVSDGKSKYLVRFKKNNIGTVRVRPYYSSNEPGKAKVE